MNRDILIIALIVFLILTLNGCDSSAPSEPRQPGNMVSYKCISGYVYVQDGYGLANFIEDGKFKECK